MVNRTRSAWRFCAAVERPDLWDEPRYRTNPGRVAAREELIPLLQTIFHTRKTADWIRLLLRENILAGPVNDIPTVLNDPQVEARQMVQEIEHVSVGSIKLIGPVAKLSTTPAEIRIVPPPLGCDTEEVLVGYLNISPDDIDQLKNKGLSKAN